MDDETEKQGTVDSAAELPSNELKLEQEKLKLERERLLLEQERLQAMRQNLQLESKLDVDRTHGHLFSLSTLMLFSLIGLLLGCIAGALTTSLRAEQQYAQRLQDAMRTFNEALAATTTNAPIVYGNGSWLRVSIPKAAHTNVASVVVQ